jgi:formylglycine-generating enzyme
MQISKKHFIESALVDCPFYMLRIPAGSFDMGDEVGDLKVFYSPSNPIHNRSGPSFYLAQTQVTQALWQTVLERSDLDVKQKIKSNPSDFLGASRPVEQVSWTDIQIWLQCLNQITGKTYRLPFEAEWEYASRSPLREKALRKLERYAGSDQMNEVGWFEENEDQSTRASCLKMPNGFGLYDMSGNVWEWCQDHFLIEYNPKNTNFSTFEGGGKLGSRVMRGGSFLSGGYDCRVAFRGDGPPAYGGLFNGFRLALSLSSQECQNASTPNR